MSEPVQVWLVPHTRWDREWYEPFSVLSERLVEVMDTLLDLGAAGSPHFHLDGVVEPERCSVDRRSRG